MPNPEHGSIVNWITNPPSGEEVTNIYRMISVFPITKKNYWILYPDIKSWGQLVKAPKNLLSKRYNING